MYIHPFTALIANIEVWAIQGGYAFIFFISIIEAMPLVGTVIPGHTAVVISGFLAQLEILNLWLVMIVASLGAIVGDLIGFYLGRKYGLQFIERFKRHFFFKQEYIEKTRAVIHAHVGKALFFGRFNPLTRPYVPFLVGVSHTPIRKFWFYNIIGGVTWAVSSVLVGYIFGYGYRAAAGIFGKAVVVAILFALIAMWGYRFANSRFQIFRKYELFVLILCLISLGTLFETIQDAWASHSFMANFDVWVNVFMGVHTGNTLTQIGTIISTVGSMVVMASAGIALGLGFLFRKKWRSATISLLSVFLTLFSVGYLKSFFLRVRPENSIHIILTDPSFPSGHAAMAAAFFVVFVYLFTPLFRSWIKREIFIVICVLFTFAVGFSRLVLSVHWASDVIAGWSLGVFCSTSVILLVRYIGALIKRKN
jgi:membrane protein DedA with SNARE-associated domain/membrane-associated phospholipid phosphatase